MPNVAFSEKLLNDGEKLVLDLRPHIVFLAPAAAAFAVAVIGSLVTWAVMGETAETFLNWVRLAAVHRISR